MTPDITDQPWDTAAYRYSAPDAPVIDQQENAWDAHADDWED